MSSKINSLSADHPQHRSISAFHSPNSTCIPPPPSHLLHNHHNNHHPAPCLRSRPSLCPLSLWNSHGSWPSAPTRSCPRCCHTSLPSARGWKVMAVQEPSALSPSAQVSIPPTPRRTSVHYRLFRYITKAVGCDSIDSIRVIDATATAIHGDKLPPLHLSARDHLPPVHTCIVAFTWVLIVY